MNTPADLDARGSSSPERSLTSLLRRGSIRRDKASSAAASEDASMHDEQSPRRRTGLGKLKGRSTPDHDASERPPSGDSKSRLTRLMRSGSKRRKDSTDAAVSPSTERAPDDDAGPRDRFLRRNRKAKTLLAEQEFNSRLHVNASAESLGLSPSGASSLLTEDSDPDVSFPRSSSLTPHHSHQDYLTFTSPLIDAQTSRVSPVQSPGTSAWLPRPTSPPSPSRDPSASDASARPQPSRVSSTSETIVRKSSNPTHPTLTLNDSNLAAFDADRRLQDTPGSVGSSSSFTHIFSGIRRSATAAAPRQDVTSAKNTLARPASAGQSVIPASPTPATLVTPPTPTIPDHRSPSPPKSASSSKLSLSSIPRAPRLAAVPSDKGINHRRARSATSASKTSFAEPTLTPFAEEAQTPGGTVISPSASSGFFSSFWASTQNAVSTISNTLTQTGSPTQRKRSETTSSDPQEPAHGAGGEEVILTNPRAHPNILNGGEQEPPEPAVKTLGLGNLSLSHLGFDESPTMTTLPKMDSSEGLQQYSSSAGGMASYESDASHPLLSSTNEKPGTPVVNDTAPRSRPRSINSGVQSMSGGDMSPPRTAGLYDFEKGLTRTGSTRSRLSGKRRHKRSRGSSAATGSAIAAALASSHSALAHPSAALSNTQIQGFAVASSKRNKDFHALFKSVPEDDYLIEDYSAALQRDILLHGRLYVSEKHVCFSSNILGWVTNLVMSYDEIVALEKKSTALIFPNAITIQTLHAKNTFASFLNRDQTYDLLIGIWKIGHPNLKPTENGHMLDENKGDAAESLVDEEELDDSDYSGDDGDSRTGSLADGHSSVPPSEMGGGGEAPRAAPKTTSPGAASPNASGDAGETGNAAALGEFPGPKEHAPTEVPADTQTYEKSAPEGIIPAPLGKVYSVMFGPESGAWMRKFLVEDQKMTDLQLEDDKKGLGEETKQSSFSYVKALNAPVGPKQTKCIVNQNLDLFDLNKAVIVTWTVQTPDVPSGNSFVIKTKYCLTWAAGNATKVDFTFQVEWSAKSWLKNPIEKGSNDGQMQYAKDLMAYLRNQFAAKGKGGNKSKGRGKKKRVAATSAEDDKAASGGDAAKSSVAGQVAAALGPVGDILAPLLTTHGVLVVLLVLVTGLWLRSSFGGSSMRRRDPLLEHASRMAAYEELWKREEAQLWDWLEDRVQLDETGAQAPGGGRQVLGGEISLQAAEQRMGKQQMEDAIRVTEERLLTLKAAREKKQQ